MISLFRVAMNLNGDLNDEAYFILTQLPAREDDRPGGGPRYTLPRQGSLNSKAPIANEACSASLPRACPIFRYSPYLMATQAPRGGCSYLQSSSSRRSSSERVVVVAVVVVVVVVVVVLILVGRGGAIAVAVVGT